MVAEDAVDVAMATAEKAAVVAETVAEAANNL
jgi:hypothetical protein